MAAPVINSRLALSALVNVPVRYQIHATNIPTSYGATPVPDALTFSTSTGLLQGKIVAAGVYTIAITATNGDGTDTDNLVITATDSGVADGGTTGVSVYQSKFWTTVDETLDYADLDSTGHPICAFDPGVIGSTQLANSAISNKVTAIGKPGLIGKYTFEKDYLVPEVLRGRVRFATVTMPGVSPGDIVVTSELRAPYLVEAAIVCIGVARTNAVDLYAYHEGTTNLVILATMSVNFRVFTF